MTMHEVSIPTIEDDGKIIRGLNNYKKDESFSDDVGWINCVLHNIGEGDKALWKKFNNSAEYNEAISKDDDFVLALLIIHSFERFGFDSKVKCKIECEWYKNKKGEKPHKLKTHPILVLTALTELKGEKGVNNIEELFKKYNYNINTLAKDWFDKIPKECFNKKFNEKYLISFLEFFPHIDELRNRIKKNNFEEAYKCLTKMKGVGPKIAKYIMRDLAFSLTEWGKNEELDTSTLNDPEILKFVIPIDIWERRICASIPTIYNRLKDKLKPSDFADSNMDIVDDKLSLTIAEACYEMKLNPIFFDNGVYFFGADTFGSNKKKSEREIRNENGEVDTQKIYSELKEKFLTTSTP